MHQEPWTTAEASDRLAELACGLLLVAALAAGGGSRGAGDALVTLFALPTVFLACVRWSWRRQALLQGLAVLLISTVVGWHLFQLVPLPASWVARLPMRPSVFTDLKAAGLSPAWLPASLDLWGSVRSLVACVVFGALFALLCTLAPHSRIGLLKLVVIAGCIMALFGYAQAAAGRYSSLRLYDYHHSIGALGSFANRNHFASLMAMLVPVALALAAREQSHRRLESAIWYCASVLLLLAAGLSFSRTGFLLACAAALSGLCTIRGHRHWRTMLAGGLVALAGTAMVFIYAWEGISLRLQQDPLQDLRWQYLKYGWEAAKAYFPWGAGPGTFRYVYAPFEPVASLAGVYALHAHDDLLELAVEWGIQGVVSAAAMLALLLGAVRNKLIVARDRSPILVGTVIAVTVPMLHSLVDYPLRTYGIMAVYALVSSIVDGEARMIKGLEDRFLALLILVLIMPLMAVIALGVKFSSPGPVLFRQKRHGLDCKPIDVWKFRSMQIHDEANGKVTQATRHDPRVTPFGRFLRRTSLDELPQFFNVLQGTMSIVGPRPHAIEHNDYYKSIVQNYMQRHRMKPGITGWAQVNGLRGETDTIEKMSRRVDFDLYYLQNWSVMFDLRIIAMTVVKGFMGKAAY